MDWATLPVPLLKRIFSLLKCTDLARAFCVNSTWNILTYNNDFWRESIFNESFPCAHSYSKENVHWRQIARNYFQTKKNIINRRCVQSTLGVEYRTSNPRGYVRLRWQSVGGKYCLVVWDISDMTQSPTKFKYLATELWDLETRTVVQNYPFEAVTLKLFGDYILEINNDYEAFYAKLDPKKSDMLKHLEHKIQLKNVTYETVIQNEDQASSLVALRWHVGDVRTTFIQILDLRTGEKILEKSYDYEPDHYMSVCEFNGDNLIMRYLGDTPGHVLILNVRQNKEISFTESYITCLKMAGDDIWIASEKMKCIVKYNLPTMKRYEYEFSEITSTYSMNIVDGIIWYYSFPKILLIDVSSNKCQILTSFSVSDAEAPEITQLPSGKIVLTNDAYAHILSFRDEDIELPISILQLEPRMYPENAKILNIKQGDLNKIISEHFKTDVISEIVLENPTNRLIMIYSHGIGSGDFNLLAYKLKESKYKKTDGSGYHHKTSVIRLVHFDYEDMVHGPFDPIPELTAYGPCWIVYEQKINGSWRKISPADNWQKFITTLASLK